MAKMSGPVAWKREKLIEMNYRFADIRARGVSVVTFWRTKVRANLIAANLAARTMPILNACTYLDVQPCAVIETGVRGQTRFHWEHLEKRTRRLFF